MLPYKGEVDWSPTGEATVTCSILPCLFSLINVPKPTGSGRSSPNRHYTWPLITQHMSTWSRFPLCGYQLEPPRTTAASHTATPCRGQHLCKHPQASFTSGCWGEQNKGNGKEASVLLSPSNLLLNTWSWNILHNNTRRGHREGTYRNWAVPALVSPRASEQDRVSWMALPHCSHLALPSSSLGLLSQSQSGGDRWMGIYSLLSLLSNDYISLQ